MISKPIVLGVASLTGGAAAFMLRRVKAYLTNFARTEPLTEETNEFLEP